MEYDRYVKILFGRMSCIVRSDGGGEYIRSRFYAAEGIMAQFTTAYTPQKNDIVERRYRNQQEITTITILDTKSDHQYWGRLCLQRLTCRAGHRRSQTIPFLSKSGRKEAHVGSFAGVR